MTLVSTYLGGATNGEAMLGDETRNTAELVTDDTFVNAGLHQGE